MDGRSPHYLWTGLFAAVLVLVLFSGLSVLFSPEFYQSWVAFIGIASVPALLVCGLVWRYMIPAPFSKWSQPAKGLAYSAIISLAMLVGGAFLFFIVGKGAGPTPMAINAAIMSIVMAFWVIVAWQCWPLTRFIHNKLILGITAWALSYVLAYIVYEIFFNFEEARHAPFYRPELDPHGIYDSWIALTFAVSSSAIIVIFEKLFAFWPIRRLPGAQSPAVFAAYTSALVLAVTGALVWLFLKRFGFEIVDFMLRGPIALLFGMFFVTNLTQSHLFENMPQPQKGSILLAMAIVIGVMMEEGYRLIAPMMTGVHLMPGPPHYALELWVATALLGITFPLIVLLTGVFDFWPIRRSRAISIDDINYRKT